MSDSKKTILIVDDEKVNVTTLVSILRDTYRLKMALSGKKAVEIAYSDDSLDLILLDIEMPGLSGYEVCKELKKDSATQNIPIIFTTGKTEIESEIEGFKLGAEDYIKKPYHPPVVKARVAKKIEEKVYRDSLEALVQERTHTLNLAMEKLAASNETKQAFLNTISHELRTPMHGIFGGLQMIMEQHLEEQKEPIEVINNSAEDMMRLINDTLIYTEIQAEKVMEQFLLINPGELIQKEVQVYKKKCEMKGVTFQCKIDTHVFSNYLVDERKLVIILNKLLDNAVKYTEKGSVHVVTKISFLENAIELILEIVDTGIGIEAIDQEKIFMAFTQHQQGFQRPYGGLGIGLAICKSLSTSLGGSICVASTLGEGSTFRVNLPIKNSSDYVENTKKNTISYPLSALIVEDNPINQKILVKMMEKLGFSVQSAFNGKQALELIEVHRFSVVLMDLQMPVMDGFTCTEKIRQRHDEVSDVPIIAVTANIMDADRDLCKKVGIDEVLSKPLKLEELCRCLGEYGWRSIES